ncbi:MAG TPA: signal recognition particle protein [Planctomycetota bacterium]|jgi:signal recognition particle subunit SRP54|nr:signal recognition particle protein [Planctomycetota bacterium]
MFDSLTSALARAFEKLRGHGRLTEANIEEGLRAVRVALLEADVHFKVVKDLIERVKARAVGEEVLRAVAPSQQIVKVFHDELVQVLGGKAAELELPQEAPAVILLAGLQGSGKTTSAAKLALHLQKKGKKTLLVAADLKRPGAVEQLKTLGAALRIPVYSEEGGVRASAVARRGVERGRVEGADVAILDTAGRLHVDEEMMREIAEVKEATKPHRVLLVLDAMTGQDAVASARAFADRLGLDGVILTKLDGDARGGAALSVRTVVGCPILFVGVGEKTADLEPFHPDRMASRILGMGDVVSLVERAQEVIREEDAQAELEKLTAGEFTLEDLFQNLQRLKRMGPLKKVLGLLPGGLGNALEGMDDRSFSRTESIFLSMTPEERRHPDRIDGGRRARIARGSGNPVSAVNDLLHAHRAMRKQMKEVGSLLSGGGGASRMLKQLRRRGFPPGSGFPGAGAGAR